MPAGGKEPLCGKTAPEVPAVQDNRYSRRGKHSQRDPSYADAAVAAVADPLDDDEVSDDFAGDEGALPSEPDEVPAGFAAGLLPVSTDEELARESVR